MKILIYTIFAFFSIVNLISQERTYQVEPLKEFSKGMFSILRDNSCFDADNCIIVRTDENGYGMIAEKTSDGGRNWVQIYADTAIIRPDSLYNPKNDAQRVKYFADGTVIMLADRGKILRSEDYGETFSEYKIENFNYSGFDMLDKNRAIITSSGWIYYEGSENFIKISYDGCKTWEDFKLSDTNYLDFYRSVYFLPDDKMIIHLNSDPVNSNLVITDFEGTFWKYFKTPRYINKMHFFDDNEGIGVGRIYVQSGGDTAVISKTYDGGENWEVKLKTVFPFSSFSDIGYMNDSLIMVSSSSFGVFYSTDKGESWFEPILIYTKDSLRGSGFSEGFTKISDDVFYLRALLPSQFLKFTRITSSVTDATLKPTKIYPNPIYIGSSFTSEYELKSSGMLKMYISDLGGREILQLFNGFEESGHHSRTFNFPETIGSGSYWLVSEVNGYRHVQMLNVVK
jgi:photosystem II stability/assembly factor-like uncharacterized protein